MPEISSYKRSHRNSHSVERVMTVKPHNRKKRRTNKQMRDAGDRPLKDKRESKKQ